MSVADTPGFQPSISELDPEEAFLCAVLRDEQPAWPDRADPGFTHRLFNSALLHGVHGLVWEKSRGTSTWEDWPESLRAELGRVAKVGAAAELLRRHRLEAALGRVRQHEIDVLLLKGAALARTHYSNPGVRPRSDTDLFIRMGDIERVCDLLSGSGLEIVPPIYKSHQFRAVSWQEPAPLILDVHWRISNDPRYARFLGFEEAWAVSVAMGHDPGLRRLCTADALMLACVHRSSNVRSGRERLVWLYDIRLLVAEMTEQQSAQFAETAVARGIGDECADGLQQAGALLNANVSEKALELLAPGQRRQRKPRRFSDSNLALLIDDFCRLPGKRSRWQLARELLLPAPDLLLRKYGKKKKLWLPWLYLRQAVSGVFKRLSLH